MARRQRRGRVRGLEHQTRPSKHPSKHPWTGTETLGVQKAQGVGHNFPE